MSTAENPFSAPLTEDIASPLSGAFDLAEAERIRTEHIQHEMSVKSIGLLYYLSAFVLGGLSAFLIVRAPNTADPILAYILSPVCMALAVVSGAVGYGIRGLASWSRIPVIVLSILGLFNPPIGTLINLYILYLVVCKKGKVVLAPEYQEIIRQTPHVKYKTSLASKIALVLLVLLLIGIIAMIAVA